ncbi:phosphopantetheine-binding protein [Yinghuangia soli]|uniref:Phosphopantetheine-binding protein n=1 Tax=Yinghuangia soli TaxID=2908204 RepID=A0AA41U2R1_9ACTN|nr:phosphopantetheine-binding protein [Yinghuangia soli]MCF2532033.1 phosphopantetheine-binding protein [Yinghuangia soli]
MSSPETLHAREAAREDAGLSTAYAAPRTELEERLVQLWEAALQFGPVGIADDFFELGGDSMLAAQVQLDVDLEFGVEISAAALFLSPTVATLAEAVEDAVKTGRTEAGGRTGP